jgi:ParB family chromosome partitioning protein
MASKRKALGKGLSALISEEFDKIDENSILNIGIDLIKSNPLQPRKNFDEEKIDELSKSIERHGIIQPVIVKKSGKHYELIAGERRWRAARQAGLKEIPSIIRDIDNRSQEEIALIENIQREDLNSIDEAVAYKVVMDRYEITQEEVSTMVGKSRVYVTNIMRLLKLPDYVQKYIIEGKMTAGHGKAVAGLGENEIKAVTDKILKEDLSVRETEKIVRELKSSKKDDDKKTRKNEKEPNILHIEEVLMNELGTKVEINKRKKSGKIQLFFSNDDELQRILNIISDKLS